ncbi:MAG: long-chain fatty acid--CoA ligase [Thermodesulfobacteriota bacterium]
MTFPWVRQYDPGVPLDIEPAETSLSWLLIRAAARSPQSPALAFAGQTITYQRLGDQAARLAQALKTLGFSPGERLAILLPNCPQLVMAYYAALHLGGVVVLNNPLLSPPEIAYQLKDSGCRYLLMLDHLWPKVEPVLRELDLAHLLVTGLGDYLPWPLKWLYALKARWQGGAGGFRPGSGRHKWRDLLRSPALTDPPQGGLEDPAVLQYTGGTTGTPKAAVLTHGNLLANVAQISAWLPRVRYGEERLVGLIPFFHAFGLTACLNWPVSQGAMIIVLPRFEIKGFLDMLKKYRPTMLPGVPTLFVALINHPDLARYDLSSLWACISGSAPLPQEVRDRFEAITGCRILEGYGLTETSPVTHINPLLGERPPGSMGLPLPGTEARVVDAESGERELPVGEVGELVLRGPQIMAGYLNRPQETALVLRDGWLYTGDLARMDEKGYFYIIDRKKDLIINGGYKVYPREVEEILYQHPRVKEAVVLGVPDAYRGEVVKVVIVPQDGAPLTVEDISQYLTPRLAAYKLPKIIEFRGALPKSQVGKVLRRVLREEAAPPAAAHAEGAEPRS